MSIDGLAETPDFEQNSITLALENFNNSQEVLFALAERLAKRPNEENTTAYYGVRESSQVLLAHALCAIAEDPDTDNQAKADYMASVSMAALNKRAEAFKKIAPKARFFYQKPEDYNEMVKVIIAVLDSGGSTDELVAVTVGCYAGNLEAHETQLMEAAPGSRLFRIKEAVIDNAGDIGRIAAGAFIGSLLARQASKKLDL